MAEMNRVARWFVNRSSDRATHRRIAWLSTHLTLPPGARCLEVGCGNGAAAAAVIETFHPASYEATDLDPRQLDAARAYLGRRFPSGLPAGLSLRQADMRDLGVPEASLDAVFAFFAIHHASPNHRDFSQVPAALEEIARALRPGGVLVYEEFVHRAVIRLWLHQHGFVEVAERRQWRRELRVVGKYGSSQSQAPPTPPRPPGTLGRPT